LFIEVLGIEHGAVYLVIRSVEKNIEDSNHFDWIHPKRIEGVMNTVEV